MLSNHTIEKLSLTLLITAVTPAYAYIDPGTGSLIIQSIIGAIAAVGITLKLYWHKLKVLFLTKKNTAEEKIQDEKPKEK